MEQGEQTLSGAGAGLLQPGYGAAFVREGFGAGPQVAVQSAALAGLRLAVKDVFAVQGLRMSAGNPQCWAQSGVARRSATPVQLCLQAGAQWVGKTVTDELALGLDGCNAYYGMPCNSAYPAGRPGGSSSGSAAAVAAGHADIALGTDSAGSCRLPASYCGIWGMRPSHGLVSHQGSLSLAPSFDTVGWFARSAADLTQVWQVLAQPLVDPGRAERPGRIWCLPETWALCDAPVQERWQATGPKLAQALSLRLDLEMVDTHPARMPVLPLGQWAQAQRDLLAHEVWGAYGAWVAQHGHSLGGDTRAGLLSASRVSERELALAQQQREQAQRQLGQLLDQGFVLLPTVPGGAPLRQASPDCLAQRSYMAQQLLCLAGLAGLPQVSFPWCEIAGAPLGLSLIGPPGSDAQVLAAAAHCHGALQALDGR